MTSEGMERLDDLEEMEENITKVLQKRFGLTNQEVESMESYRKKAETAEVKYCDLCTSDFYDFESTNGVCPICWEEIQ